MGFARQLLQNGQLPGRRFYCRARDRRRQHWRKAHLERLVNQAADIVADDHEQRFVDLRNRVPAKARRTGLGVSSWLVMLGLGAPDAPGQDG